jgi:2'-5' RNA ligase
MPRELALVVPFSLPIEPAGVHNDVGPHVTVIVPAPGDTARILDALAPFSPFDVTFARFGRFPVASWLAPEPCEPFVAMTEAVMAAFPGYLPYGGEFSEIVPHLTVAQERIDEMEASIEPLLPLRGRAEAVVLYEHVSGMHWRNVHSFAL